MRLSRIVLSAVASAAFLGAANVDVFAQDNAAATAKSGEQATFDESLFDVKNGEKADYYLKRLNDINASFGRYANAEKDRAKLTAQVEKLRAAQETIFKNLADAADLKQNQRDAYFGNYAMMLLIGEKTDELEALKAKNADNPTRLAQLKYFLFSVRLNKAAQAQDSKELAKTLDEIKVETLENEAFAEDGVQLLSNAARMDAKVAGAALEEIVAKFAASDKAVLKELAQRLEGQVRFAKLVGNEMKVEGLCLDKTEIDWNSYRGKVVLVDFWATWCGPCVGEIPNVKKMYEKYAAAGFDVLGYSLDEDLDALKKFEEEKKLPWKTASRKLSQDAEKEYLDLTRYYGITGIPTMILVDKDGKVIDTGARGEHLQELLEKEFPEVK